MKKEIKNIEASVRARLENKAQETKRPFAEILQYYAMERFLYRLSQTEYKEKFILKGALMFVVWQIPNSHSTVDIDFLARYQNEITEIEKVIKNVCHAKVTEDGLFFDPETVKVQKIKKETKYEGVRGKFQGLLGRARISMQVDVGFRDAVYPKPKAIDYPVILDFPKPQLKGYTIETVVAEKFEAMVKLGFLNSRMKDFYDLWLMTRQFEFEGESLSKALQATFTHRKTLLPIKPPYFAAEIYDKKSDRQTLWSAFLTKNRVKNTPGVLSQTAEWIEVFLESPLKALTGKTSFKHKWKAPGPWL